MSFNYRPYMVSNPEVCGGESVIAGTRVTLRTVLASMAEGISVEEILAEFPSLTRDSIKAVFVFAAVSAEEDLPMPAVPAFA